MSLGDAADSSVKVMMYAVDVDDFVADSKPVEGKEEELIFEPPGGTTDDIKIVLSGNRCLFWNKRNGTVDELLFNNIKAPPSPQRMWDSKDDPVMDITGGTDGRFIISTKEAARMLTGDKLEEIKIGNEWTGGNNHQWALGDGWEIVYTYDGDIYGRGKSEFRSTHTHQHQREPAVADTPCRRRERPSELGKGAQGVDQDHPHRRRRQGGCRARYRQALVCSEGVGVCDLWRVIQARVYT